MVDSTTFDARTAERIAAELVASRAARHTRGPLTDEMTLSMDDAYRIQGAVTATRRARGERQIGWKLGYTSLAMRAQMGVDQPNFGPLTDAMVVADGASVPDTVLQPRVEPEVAIRLRADIEWPTTLDDVAAAVGSAHACLEVVDSVYTGYRFRIEDNTADGSSAAHVVIGAALSPDASLDEVGVELVHNDVVVGQATGAAASGHPLAGVVWLAEALAVTGQQLRAGDLIITGGLTAAVALNEGDVVSATFAVGQHIDKVTVRRAGRATVDE